LDIPFFNSLESFLASGIETDVINIATPNGLHAQQAIACLNAKINVVVEKPIALTRNDAKQIISKRRK
jgi:predicted dehydrogenase